MSEAASVTLVTGAGSGIGAAVAARLARRGDRLALAHWGGAAPALEHPAGRDAVLTGSVDVRERAQVDAFVAAALDSFGRIDVLVTAAGVYREGASESFPWSEWEEVLTVNLTGTFACVRAVLPAMLRRGAGQVVTIASELGLAGAAEAAAYSASKGGVIALTKALAREYAGAGIRFNSVAPGPVRTPLLEGSTRHFRPEAAAALPIGRFGEPEEIAAVVEALTGEAGSFFVGQVVSPNGGAVI